MTRALTIVVLLILVAIPGYCLAEGRTNLPKGGGEPGRALTAFLEAAYNRDLARIRSMYPDEVARRATDKEIEASILLFSRFNPAEMTIAGGTIEGDSATLDTSHGTIVMNRTSGKWIMGRWEAHAAATLEATAQAEINFDEGTVGSSIGVNSSLEESPENTQSEHSGSLEPQDVPRIASFTFDPQTLKVLPEEEKGGQVIVVASGEERMLFHNVENYGEAAKAAAILKYYNVNEVVEISMPGELENIYLKSGKAPSGKYAGEQCASFAPVALAVTEYRGTYRSQDGKEVVYTQWSIADGKRTVTRYNDKPFAEEMASILRKYGFTNRCHAGGFWYFRK